MQCYKYDPFDSTTWDFFDVMECTEQEAADENRSEPSPPPSKKLTEKKAMSVSEAQKLVETATSREQKEAADAAATRALEMQEMRDLQRAEARADDASW